MMTASKFRFLRLSVIAIGTAFLVHGLIISLIITSNARSPDFTDATAEQELEDLLHHGEFRLKPRQPFSSAYCRHFNSYGATCLFSNVGLQNEKILFYDDPDNPVDYISSRVRVEVNNPYFFGVRGGNIRFARDYLILEKIKGPIPAAAHYSDQNLTVLLAPHWPENLGHFLVEDIFAAFSVLYDFGLPTDEIHLTLLRDCHSIYAGSNMLQLCLKSYMERIKGIFPQNPPLYLTPTHPYSDDSLQANLSKEANALYSNGPGIFFQNVVGGTGEYAFKVNKHLRAFPWQLFRQTYLKNFGIQVQQPKKQKIALMVKKGRRSIVNMDDVVEMARKFEVDVELIEPPGVTWGQELEILTSSTVFFTVPGGVSFSAGFLNKKSVAVIVDLWIAAGKPCTRSFENHWWENLGAFHSMNYMLDENEVKDIPGIKDTSQLTVEQLGAVGLPYDAKNVVLTEAQRIDIVRHYHEYHLNIAKLQSIFCSALHQAEQNYGWNATYRKTACSRDLQKWARDESAPKCYFYDGIPES